MTRQILSRLYVVLVVAPLLPFAALGCLGGWINNWRWPERYAHACDRFGSRIGLDMS